MKELALKVSKTMEQKIEIIPVLAKYHWDEEKDCLCVIKNAAPRTHKKYCNVGHNLQSWGTRHDSSWNE